MLFLLLFWICGVSRCSGEGDIGCRFGGEGGLNRDEGDWRSGDRSRDWLSFGSTGLGSRGLGSRRGRVVGHQRSWPHSSALRLSGQHFVATLQESPIHPLLVVPIQR